MSKKDKFTWTSITDPEDGITTYEGENSKFIGCVEYVGDDMFGNPLWYASLIDKAANRMIPVSVFGLPFTSSGSAKEAILRAVVR